MKSRTQKARTRVPVGNRGPKARKPGRAKAQQAGRPTFKERERRKATVMKVATELFVQHGYAATSLVDIAKAAGVATRTVYTHFGDKEAIFMDVVTAREDGAVFQRPPLDESATLFDALMNIARYICDVSFRPRSVDLMRITIAESRRFPNFMMNLIHKTIAHFRSEVTSMFDELTARKLAPQSDTAMPAALFVDLILGITPLLVYAGWSASRPTEAELEEKIEFFIRGSFGLSLAQARAQNASKSVAVSKDDRAAPRKRA
jgi:AcrR family transcriptional regulator